MTNPFTRSVVHEYLSAGCGEQCGDSVDPTDGKPQVGKNLQEKGSRDRVESTCNVNL
jgi:hypothetical protein